MSATQITNHLLESVQEVFETMSFQDAMPIEGEVASIGAVDISACICLGGQISGMLAFHCSRDFARNCHAHFNAILERMVPYRREALLARLLDQQQNPYAKAVALVGA